METRVKNRINTFAVLVTVPMVFVAGLALAQTDPAELMATLDADGNGSISKEEAAANEALMGQWDLLDADADGEINAEELAAMAEG